MLGFLENLFSHISPLMAYLVFLLSAYAENVLPPVPGDTVVVLGAYLVSTGQLDFWGVYLATTFGSEIGFLTMYLIGRRYGRSFIYNKKYGARMFKEEHIRKVEKWFSRWGYWVIFANRFLSGTRSVISLFAGSFHLHPVPVILLSTLSALIWNALLLIAGMLLGKNWQVISDIISRYNQVFIVLFIGLLIFLVFRFRKKRVSKKGTE
jgi:membrane protein DedA with SNARE-associated domain